MMKKSLKKMIICFFMMVGIMGAVAVPTEAKSHVNYTKIYKKFAKKQVKKKKKNQKKRHFPDAQDMPCINSTEKKV